MPVSTQRVPSVAQREGASGLQAPRWKTLFRFVMTVKTSVHVLGVKGAWTQMHLTEAVRATFTSIAVSVSIPFAIVAARNGNRFGPQVRKHEILRRCVRHATTHLKKGRGNEVAYNADVQCTIVLPCVRTGECPDEPLARLVFAQAGIQEVGARACAPLSHKWRSADDNRRLARSGVHWQKH